MLDQSLRLVSIIVYSAVRSPLLFHKFLLQQSKKIEFHMPTELAPSQPMTMNQERVTVTYMAKMTERQNPSDNIISDEASEPGQQHQQGPAETAALSGVVELPVDATVGDGAEGEREEEEVEKFITLAELTANRLSDAGMYVLHCTWHPTPVSHSGWEGECTQ